MDPERLVIWIVATASRQGIKLTETRVVKFLYLADVVSQRMTGKPLTIWPWKFWKYGPYCLESLDALRKSAKSGDIVREGRPSQYQEEDEYSLYSVEDPDAVQEFKELPISVIGKMEKYIKEWGSDTHALLDHVYFHTEPMMSAKPGEKLDFSKIRPWESFLPIEPKPLSLEAIVRARAAIERMPPVRGVIRPFGFAFAASDRAVSKVSEVTAEENPTLDLRIEPDC